MYPQECSTITGNIEKKLLIKAYNKNKQKVANSPRQVPLYANKGRYKP